jgi:hypothetical protein
LQNRLLLPTSVVPPSTSDVVAPRSISYRCRISIQRHTDINPKILVDEAALGRPKFIVETATLRLTERGATIGTDLMERPWWLAGRKKTQGQRSFTSWHVDF